jgi:hypothetical protein
MSKEKDKFDFNQNWYDVWMKQSKEFFDTAEKNLKGVFNQDNLNPQDHMKQINDWMETLKNKWQAMHLDEQQKAYINYWNAMSKMSMDANEMMLKLWMQRSKEHNPIKNIPELYELWLNCCNEVYKNAMHSKSYQEAYGEFMNAAIQFWKSALNK